MGIDTKIKDGAGSGKELRIDENHAALVSDLGVPPNNLTTGLRPFTEFFKNDVGSIDMRVDGSTNHMDFFIEPTADGDRFIHTLSITISDAGATLSRFGFITALTNGCSLIYNDADLGDVTIADSLKTNFDFIQMCNFEPTFGTGNEAFRANNVAGTGGQSEAYIPILDIEDVFGLRYGIRLPKETNKSSILRVFDDTTGVDRFDIKAFGFYRISKK